MNTCIAEDVALQIVLHPVSVSGDTMAHVYCCKKCQRLLKETVDDVLDDCFEVTTKNVWSEFKEFLEQAFSNVKKEKSNDDSLWDSLLTIPVSFVAGLTCSMLSNSISEGSKRQSDTAVFCKLVFNASVEKDHQRFWEAELLLPDDFSDDASLVFILTTRDGSAIEEGILHFSNLQIPIFMGLANTTFGAFRQALKVPEISVTFADNETVVGELVFFEKQ